MIRRRLTLAISTFISLTLCITGLSQEITLPAELETITKPASAPSDIYKSVVRIEAATQVPDYRTPWNSGRFSGGIGTGFLIGKNKFLTNAHVVSNAKRLLITTHGSPRKHPAKIKFIAHDCDLALLELEDFSPFEDSPYLKIGATPKLESKVRAIGYPVGGDRLSVTQGVVSRIDFRTYAHSIMDSHLIVQVDAAINPGNSGGPVLQEGKVVGVAFQGLRSADNTGYMIPPPVIKRFLKDIEDGVYNRYVDLGFADFPLYNAAMRKALNLEDNNVGALVARVNTDGPSYGLVEEGDILLSIDGLPIDSAGMVLLDGEKVTMHEVGERKFAGDSIKLTFLRGGQQQEADIILKPFEPTRIYAVRYGEKPRYFMTAGLGFQPLNRNTYTAHKLNDLSLRDLFSNYIDDEIFKERKDIVVLTTVLSDKTTSFASRFKGLAIDEINGIKISDLRQAFDLLHPKEAPEFITLTFIGEKVPLVLRGEEMQEATKRIANQYGITETSYLGE